MTGWIKLHRKSLDNFLYKTSKPHTRREAWEDILMLVNYEDNEWIIGNEKIQCKKGQSVMSLESWGKVFNWDKSRVKRFFQLLIKNEMIVQENLQKTTRITVCNYETYQGEQNVNETQKKRKRNAKETPATPIKEDKEIKEITKEKNEFNFLPFYLTQIEAAKAYLKEHPEVESNVDEYKRFVVFLHDWKNREAVDPLGNSIHSPLTNVLKIEKQLRFDQFVNHFARAKELGINFYSKLSDMENTPKSIQNKTDLNRTLFNWIKPYVK